MKKNLAFLLFLFLPYFFNLPGGQASAQIVIEERVEVDPQRTIVLPNDPNSSDYYPCSPWIGSSDYYNPWQVVWYHSSYHLDVGQQAFNYQANAYNHYINPTEYYDFNVIDGQGLCHITENYIDTVNGNYIPPTNPGYNLVGIKGSDMIGELAEGEDPGNLPLFQGIPTRGGFQKYSIFFDQPGDVTFTIKETGTNEVISYHTTIVVPDYSLNVSISNEIPHGEEESIIAEADILNCLGMGWMFFNGGGYDGSYNYEITGGLEYATLVHVYFDEILGEDVRETGTSFYNISAGEEVLVWLNGEEPDSTGLVNLTISTGIGTVNKQVNVVRNNNYPLRITINPDSLFPGDTADVLLENRVSESPYDEPVIYEPFPEDQYFNVTIVKGAEFADIYTPDTEETGDEFELIPQGFKLIIDPGIDSSDVEIKLRVSTKTGGGGFPVNPVAGGNEKELESMKQGKAEIKSESTKSSEGDGEIDIIIFSGGKEIFGIGKAVVNPEEEIEILLGETKYFQAKYVGELLDKLVIEEVSGPELNGGLEIDVWGENPVSIVEGDKLGVYWEKEKPVWNGNTKGNDLTTGLIRLVGRYYDIENDTPFKVKLTAEYGPDKPELEIVVKKPHKLGNAHQTSINVFGDTVNIDEICVEWGNELGIPPHFIKGHMKSETSASYPFYPTYLYEPYTTQKYVMRDNTDNQFFIPDDATTFDPPVPNHSNVKDYHYPTNPTSVWQMIEDYSQLVYLTPPGGWRKYGDRIETAHSSQEDGVLYFYGVYSYPQNKYNEYKEVAYKKYKVVKNTDKEPQANNEARDSLVNHLKNDWDYGIVDGVKGLINIKAQTRIAGSYGLLQMLYTSALEYDYPADSLPESLLETDNIKYAMKRIKNSFDKLIDREDNSANNWTLGLEESFKKYIWKPWNPKYSAYPGKVLENASLYSEISE